MNDDVKTEKTRAVSALLQIEELCVDGTDSIAAIRKVLNAYFAEASNARVKCEYCGGEFVVGTGTGRRITAQYCSDKHRTYASRKRLARIRSQTLVRDAVA